MTISSHKIAQLRELLSITNSTDGGRAAVSGSAVSGGTIPVAASRKNVLVVSHYNPDGDALGSSVAWMRLLEGMGHRVTCVVPNRFPHFLEWIPGIDRVRVFVDHGAEVRKAAEEADIVFCLDFNNISRLEGLTAAVEANVKAKKILIDHHLDPPRGYFDLEFSYTDASSTAYIVCKLISRLAGKEAIDKYMGTALYVGIMTDTGNFSYSNLSPDLFRTVATLVENGVDIPAINYRIYNSYSEGRVRLLGYALGPKMEMLQGGRAAVISLTEAEMRRFGFRQGDSEGFVNYPLSIETVKMSALLTQNHKFIRVSLRSRGDVDVNEFARRYFGGGGHKNAAGGKSTDTMAVTLERFRRAVADYLK